MPTAGYTVQENVITQVVHLKRGYGNLPAYGEMNHWQHCICMRFA